MRAWWYKVGGLPLVAGLVFDSSDMAAAPAALYEASLPLQPQPMRAGRAITESWREPKKTFAWALPPLRRWFDVEMRYDIDGGGMSHF